MKDAIAVLYRKHRGDLLIKAFVISFEQDDRAFLVTVAVH